LAGSAFAEGCDKVIFSDVGWTDITATTAATAPWFEALGYETETKVLSVPVTYTGLAEGDIDVFLGNWMPTMEADIAPYREAGTVETVRTNLEGAKYTLATNEAGPHSASPTSDIATHKDALEGKIYGIEPGNDGNRLILDMIASGPFGLDGFEVVESSEQGMLAEVAKATDRMAADRLPRLGTAPDERQLQDDLPVRRRRLLRPELRRRHRRDQHPRGLCRGMPEHRQASAEPRLHAGHGERDHGRDPERRRRPARCRQGLAEGQPRRLEPWLDGVTTKDGGDAKAAVKAALQ
jgi:glycine betaine/proline transport system substrate-binding protein